MIYQSYRAADFGPKVAATAAAVRQGLPQSLRQPLSLLFQADVRRQFYGGYGADGVAFKALARPRPDGSAKPLLDKGLLANSYVAEADATGVTVASAHPAAALQQAGGVVRPVNGKALTIPLTPEARRYGSPRRFPRALFRVFAALCERLGAGKAAKLVKHYLLVASAKVPARPVGFTEGALTDAAEMLADFYLARL